MPDRRRRFVALAGYLTVAVAVFATALVAGTWIGAGADAADSPIVAPPASATATTAPDPLLARVETLTTEPPLTQPEDAPTDPYADVPVVPVGTIVIPRLGLEHTVYEGVWLTVIDHGPGHWPGSAMPGGRGNTVFPGHRVTHSHPFRDLDLLAPGDEVVFRTPAGEFTYAVTSTQIVVPTDMWVVDPTEQPTMTLIACHPKHSARQRIVVKGALVRSALAS
jgi:sortase A